MTTLIKNESIATQLKILEAEHRRLAHHTRVAGEIGEVEERLQTMGIFRPATLPPINGWQLSYDAAPDNYVSPAEEKRLADQKARGMFGGGGGDGASLSSHGRRDPNFYLLAVRNTGHGKDKVLRLLDAEPGVFVALYEQIPLLIERLVGSVRSQIAIIEESTPALLPK